MERYNPASRHDALVCTPSATAIQYGGRVAPLKLPEPSVTPVQEPLPNAEAGVAHDAPSVQVFPAPDQESQNLDDSATTPPDILGDIGVTYDGHLQRLASLLKQLRQPTSSEDEEPSPICTYPTSFGELTFQELVERTRKYAAFALRYTYQVNEADVDDGLQAGYLRLWQRLQPQPELLRDKPLAWIAKGVIYPALHATRADWQFGQHTLTEEEQASEGRARAARGGFSAHSWETRQADVRLDLHLAIRVVAEGILANKRKKRQDHDLWALYGLTMLHVSASELSRLFNVREQSMQAAYKRVRQQLQEALPNYAPRGTTSPFVRRGPEALLRQDVAAIRKANGDVPDTVYEAVRTWIEITNADTRRQDELALDGIRRGIPVQTQANEHDLTTSQMQRAYERVHLMIGAQRDPNVRVRRPERRMKFVFTLTAATAAAVEQLALDLLEKPKSYEKLVALHAHIGNLAISTTAKHFNIPTSTLRYYAQQIGTQLGTPTKPAREA